MLHLLSTTCVCVWSFPILRSRTLPTLQRKLLIVTSYPTLRKGPTLCCIEIYKHAYSKNDLINFLPCPFCKIKKIHSNHHQFNFPLLKNNDNIHLNTLGIHSFNNLKSLQGWRSFIPLLIFSHSNTSPMDPSVFGTFSWTFFSTDRVEPSWSRTAWSSGANGASISKSSSQPISLSRSQNQWKILLMATRNPAN